MSEANAIPNMTETQSGAVPGSVLDWGAGPLLTAQADLLANAETTVTGWLHRRHEAVDDARQLIASMHTGVDLGDALKAQQEFVSRSFRRMAADADAYHSAAQLMINRAPAWFAQGWFTKVAETASSQAAATRAAAKPLRMANKPD